MKISPGPGFVDFILMLKLSQNLSLLKLVLAFKKHLLHNYKITVLLITFAVETNLYHTYPPSAPDQGLNQYL